MSDSTESLASEIERLKDEVVRLLDQQAKDDTEFAQVLLERDRYRSAWQSARERAQAYGEGILRITCDRESYQGWLEQEQAVTQQLRAHVAELTAVATQSRAEVIAERDAQIIAWLAKKSHEYGVSNRENRAKSEAVGRMADKLSRGAVRDEAVS